jgi:hypothetical protein
MQIMQSIVPATKGEFVIPLRGSEGSATPGSFQLEDLRGSCKLRLTFNGRSLNAMSSDFFDALVQLRRRLEKEDLLPVCYGASRNVYPADLARTLAHGLMAQRWTPGGKGREDLVFIFHTGPDVQPVTVAEQREFRRCWVAAREMPCPVASESSSKLAA